MQDRESDLRRILVPRTSRVNKLLETVQLTVFPQGGVVVSHSRTDFRREDGFHEQRQGHREHAHTKGREYDPPPFP